MKDTPRTASELQPVICPLCGAGSLAPGASRGLVHCDHCDRGLGISVMETLQQIRALPEPVGAHACECGHPEMRLLPDRVYHCPSCRTEILPLEPEVAHRRNRT